MKVSELTKQGKYVHRHLPTLFNGGSGIPTPQRKGVYDNGRRVDEFVDEFDTIFDSKVEFHIWMRDLQVGLAELDQVMNYCKYFAREKGNNGNYIRDGKFFPVHGQWCGLHDFDWKQNWFHRLFRIRQYRDYKPTEPFVKWLKKNDWDSKTWFELMDRYKA